MNVSIIGVPFLAVISASTALAVLATWRLPRRWLTRTAAIFGTFLLFVATAAAFVNAYFAYFPTVSYLLGKRAEHEASSATVWRASLHQPHLTHGLVEVVHIPASSGFKPRAAQVYLPPAWFRSPRPRLPVIELLHGTPGMTSDWTRAGQADLTADRWAVAHDGLAPVLLMVDENGGFFADTECVDGRRGKAESYLTRDVPRWAIAHLGVEAGRSGWAIAGGSEGGYCALDLAIRHPDRYAVFVDLAGLDHPTYTGGIDHLLPTRAQRLAHDPRWLLVRRPPRARLSAWFEVGTADAHTERQVLTAARLARGDGIDAQVRVVSGHHNWRFWRRSFADAFPWLAAQLGLAPHAGTSVT